MTIEETKQQLTEVRDYIHYLGNRKMLVLHGMRSDYTVEQCDYAISVWKQVCKDLAEQLEFMESAS